MNYLKQAPSLLLAFVFVVFGANYFFNFMPMPAPAGNVKAFFDLFYPTKYLLVVKTLDSSCRPFIILQTFTRTRIIVTCANRSEHFVV